MSLVQRLTGASSSSAVPQSAAIFEKSPQAKIGNDVLDQIGIDSNIDRAGILSPVPASLPTISPSFFSPSAAETTNGLSFLHDLSPASFGNETYAGNSFLISPSNLLSAQVAPSPTGYYWDLFSQYHDL